MLKQILAITLMNVRSIPERWGPSLVIVIGLAGVVAVFTALLAMANGFSSTLQSAGRSDNAIVLRGQSGAELNSGFGGDSADIIKLGPGIRKGSDGKPLASGEIIVITELLKKGETINGANVTLRGVEPASFELRPQLRIIEGRRFEPGLREIIVGAGVAGAILARRLAALPGLAVTSVANPARAFAFASPAFFFFGVFFGDSTSSTSFPILGGPCKHRFCLCGG